MQPCSQGRDGPVLKLTLGARTAAVKVFDRESASARDAYDREVTLLRALNGTGLSPRLLGYSKDDLFVVMEWIEGQTLKQVLRARADRQLGIALGTWFAGFAVAVPAKPDDTDWYSYLAKLEEFGHGAALQDRRRVLEQMPVRAISIAKNDAYLANFLISPEQHLTGIDFGESRRKPLGWDILLTARSLHFALGDEAKPVIDGMVKGWCDNAEGFDKPEFGKLVRLFLRALLREADPPEA